MAVPVYSEDLTDIELAEATTNFAALGGGGAGLSADPDFAIQGTNSITKQVSGSGTIKGIVGDNGSAITMGTDDHVFIWVYATCPGLLETIVNGGIRATIGTSVANYNDYYVGGIENYSLGGHFCWTVRYSTSIPSPGRQVGSPTANPQWFGGQLHVTGILRAANLAVDASRYGTGGYITAGEVATPATFGGFSSENDLSTNRWGILGEIAGGFILQGKFVIGQDSSKVATLAYFEDSDINITIIDTPHSLTDFTQIIIDHASTICNFKNITITALGTNNKGRFIVNSNNPSVSIVGGTWTGVGITVLRSNTSVDGLTWRGADSITLNQASIDNCLIEESIATSAVFTDDIGDINGCDFISSGTGHAVELSSIGGGVMNWDNQESSYAASDGSTGNETVYVNVGSGSLTINVTSGASIPTIRTAGATVTVVAGQVTTLITVKSLALGSVIVGARVYLLADAGGPLTVGTVIFNATTNGSGQVSDTRSLASDQPASGWVRKNTSSPFYKEAALSVVIDNANGLSITTQLVDDE